MPLYCKRRSSSIVEFNHMMGYRYESKSATLVPGLHLPDSIASLQERLKLYRNQYPIHPRVNHFPQHTSCTPLKPPPYDHAQISACWWLWGADSQWVSEHEPRDGLSNYWSRRSRCTYTCVSAHEQCLPRQYGPQLCPVYPRWYRRVGSKVPWGLREGEQC